MIPLAIAAALLLQQQVPQRSVPAGGGFDSIQTASRQAITDVGLSVAEMRTAHDMLRRAAFNFSDELVIQRAQELGQRCQALTTIARTASGRVCRTCFAATVQRALNGYRAALPGVSQVGTRCSTQLARFLRATVPAGTVRRNIWSVTRNLVEGLYPYEARLREVRQAFGLETPPPRGLRR